MVPWILPEIIREHRAMSKPWEPLCVAPKQIKYSEFESAPEVI